MAPPKYLLQILKKRNRIEFYKLKGDLEEFHDFNSNSSNTSDEEKEDETSDSRDEDSIEDE